MKTKAQVIRKNPELKTIINAVIKNIGIDSVMDVVNHGADSGFSGFIYYSETFSFYKKHRKTINKMIKDMASDIGEGKGPVEFISSFNCLENNEQTKEAIGYCLYSDTFKDKDNDDVDLVANALAWFALEEVCRLFED